MSRGAVLDAPVDVDAETLTIDDLTRREFMTGVLATAFLIACGGDEGEDATPTPATREVQDVFGPVSVPVNPQRVIANSNSTLGNMLALEVKPVGADVNLNSIPRYLSGVMEGIADVTGENYIDIEKALALNPDLIIAIAGSGGEFWNEENCRRYKEAVTTFCYEQNYVYEEDIKQNVRDVAYALNVTDRADSVIARFDARAAELRAKAQELGFDSKPVTVVRIFDTGEYSIRVGTSESIVFRALGIAQPEGQQDPTMFSIELSTENLSMLNESWAVIIYIDDTSNVTEPSLLSNPVWQSITPAQENRVIFVNSGVWNSIDILGAMEIMNDIEEQLLPLATA